MIPECTDCPLEEITLSLGRGFVKKSDSQPVLILGGVPNLTILVDKTKDERTAIEGQRKANKKLEGMNGYILHHPNGQNDLQLIGEEGAEVIMYTAVKYQEIENLP